jgi:hypothetical protein
VAFDEKLAERVRKETNCRKGVAEKRMSGGVAFLLDGNMSVGIHRGSPSSSRSRSSRTRAHHR